MTDNKVKKWELIETKMDCVEEVKCLDAIRKREGDESRRQWILRKIRERRSKHGK